MTSTAQPSDVRVGAGSMPDVATLTVRRQRVVEDPTSRVREKPPKSHNGTRSLVLDPATLTVVTGARPRGRKALVPGYMFTGRHGQPLRPDNVTDRFNRLPGASGRRRPGRQLPGLLRRPLGGCRGDRDRR